MKSTRKLLFGRVGNTRLPRHVYVENCNMISHSGGILGTAATLQGIELIEGNRMENIMRMFLLLRLQYLFYLLINVIRSLDLKEHKYQSV